MSEKSHITLLAGERKADESDKAVIACNAYLRMGALRSLRRVSASPEISYGSVMKWSVQFEWAERVSIYDAEIERAKDERRFAVIDSGLALDHERVEKLKDLAEMLGNMVFYMDAITRNPFEKYPHVWLKDVKVVGKGESQYTESVYRFNTPLIEQYRSVLGDLASETGGRSRSTEVDKLLSKIDYSKFDEEQAKLIDMGVNPLEVIVRAFSKTGTEESKKDKGN